MIHPSVPAYTIGLKTVAEPPTTNKLGPGPGTYNVRAEEVKVPAPVIGTGNRPGLFQKTNFPGPGNYNIPSFVDPLSDSSQDKKREKLLKGSSRDKSDKVRIDAPGPGSYNPQKLSTSFCYSMGNKTFSLIDEKANNVGPGQYEPNFNSVMKETGMKIGTGKRSVSVEKKRVPGPGTYEIDGGEIGPKYSFGYEKKSKINNNGEIPAPWTYDIPGLAEELKNKPGKTIGPKCWVPIKDSCAPGPGAYEPKGDENAPKYSVGTGKRTNFTKIQKIPGPGEYTPRNPAHALKASKIGTGRRPPLSAPNQTPGPGAYNIDISFGGPSHGMSGRRDQGKNQDFVPGPGQYDPIPTHSLSPHHIIGTGQRSNIEKGSRLKSLPGPGHYKIKKPEETPKWSFGKDPKLKENYEDEPGPGQYDLPPSVPDVPKYLLTAPKMYPVKT